MFFGSTARKELELVKSLLEQSRQTEAATQARVSELEAQLAASSSQLMEAQSRTETFQRTIEHLAQFGVSFQLSQQSIGQMAERLKAEQGNVSETRDISEASRIAISGTAAASMATLATEARRVSSEGGTATDNMHRLLELANHKELSLSSTTLRSFVELTKIDHLVFKFEIYKAFFGLNQLGANDVADQTTCRLGKWYYQGAGNQYYARLPGYREIERPHANVHRAGREALDALRSGDAIRGAEAVGRMEQASMEVIEALERVAREGESNPGLLGCGIIAG
jgi:hypothetical protein